MYGFVRRSKLNVPSKPKFWRRQCICKELRAGALPIIAAMLTFADERLEDVYLVYMAEKNRGLTLRLHFLFIMAWLVAALKTISQASDAYAHKEARSLPQLLLLLAAQLVNLLYQLKSYRLLSSMARRDQLQQENSKSVLHILLDVAVMICVLLSDPMLPHSPTPLPALVVGASLLVLDMVRVGTMLRLLSIKWLCFLILEADNWMRVTGRSPLTLGHDLAVAAGLGAALPVAVAVLLEMSQREAFLRDCRRPLSDLGPFWTRLLAVLGRLKSLITLGAMPSRAAATRPHED